MRGAREESVGGGRGGVGTPGKRVGEERGEGDFADTEPAFFEEPTAGVGLPIGPAVEIIVAVHGKLMGFEMAA
jgi:hypothetical protein